MIPKVYSLVMCCGLVAALFLAVLPVLGLDGQPRAHLAVSISHMLALTVIAWVQVANRRRAPANLDDVARRLANTGYVHTLIGVIASLALVGRVDLLTDAGLSALVTPMGAALITSIIGWWMGGEIQRPCWSTAPLAAVPEVDRQVALFCDRLATYNASISRATAAADKVADAADAAVLHLTRTATRAEEASTRLQTAAASFAANLNAAGETLQGLASELQDGQRQAKRISDALGALRDAVASIDALIAEMNERRAA